MAGCEPRIARPIFPIWLRALSHNDLFIPGEGTTYAVPEAIVHYIACHDYNPPQEFCEAVLRCPEPDTPEFFAALQSCGWDASVARADDAPSDAAAAARLSLLVKAMQQEGRAKASALEAFTSINDTVPATMEQAQEVVAGVQWMYSRLREGGVWVHGEWLVEGARLVFDGELMTVFSQYDASAS